MEFEKVEPEHIEKAIKDFEEKGYPEGLGPSSTYDLVIDGKNYPPKVIMAYANYHAEEKEPSNYFLGGPGKPCFNRFEELGYVVLKKEKFTWVKTHYQIADYLSTKENSQTELIELLKSVGIGPFNDKAGTGDHDIQLDEIDPFTFFCYIYKYGDKKRLELLIQIAEKLNFHIPGDERGIPSAQAQQVWLFPYKYLRTNNEVSRLWSFFHKALSNNLTEVDFQDVLNIRGTGKTKLTEALFYIDPEKYLPINGPTKPYLKEVLGISPKFNSYSEYISLLEKIKTKSEVPFYELSYEAWKWNDKKKESVPSNFNIVKEFISKIKSGEIQAARNIRELVTGRNFENNFIQVDQFFFSGRIMQIEVSNYAETIDFIENIRRLRDGHYNDFNIWTHSKHHFKGTKENLIARHDELNSELGFKDNGNGIYKAFIGKQNLLGYIKKKFESDSDSSKKYWLYSPGPNAEHWDEFFDQVIMALGWDFLGDYSQYDSQEEIADLQRQNDGSKGSKKNNSLAVFDFYHTVKPGDIIIAKRGRKEYVGFGIVTSEYILDKSRPYYQSIRKIEWKRKGTWKDIDIVLKTLTDITKYPEYVQRLKEMLGIEQEQVPAIEDMNTSLNTILYGPPGTGKTFRLQKEYFPQFTTRKEAVSRQQKLSEVMSDFSWWECIAMALIDMGPSKTSDIIAHELVSTKASLSNSKNVRATIWGSLQMHTIEESDTVNYKQRQPPLVFNKSQDSIWDIAENADEDVITDLSQTLKDLQDMDEVQGEEVKRYTFTTFHQSFAYEDFIEGIKPDMEESSDGELRYEVVDGVFKNIVRRAKSDPENNYAIFIDEINRGNVSSIFGELITLIERDKREGEKNELTCTLPYSKQRFSVPSNLYIIGTMNTADRSVEALDTALRRRFEFNEVMPDPAVIRDNAPKGGQIDEFNTADILQVINDRIEVLVDRDHTIGHSYFLDCDSMETLQTVFKNKIIPLLQEYFYGDYGKIGLVLGQGFVRERPRKKNLFPEFKYEGRAELDHGGFELIPFDEEFDLASALGLLMNHS